MLALQERLGLGNLEVNNVSFDQLVAGQVGDFDVALLTGDDHRRARARWSTSPSPYFASDQGALVMEGTEMETVEDAKALQWGVQSGTTGSTYLIDVLQPEQEPQVFQDLAAGFAALQAGQVDVFMMDTAIVLAQAAESGGAAGGGRPVRDGRGVRGHPAARLHRTPTPSTPSSPSSRPTARCRSSPRSGWAATRARSPSSRRDTVTP